MVTASIYIEPYLAEFLQGKYGNGTSAPISIPERTDLYHLLWDLMACRRINVRDESDDNLVSRDEVSADYIAHEKEILLAQIMNDPKESQKPEKVIHGMIEGRISKELKEVCLVDQVYVKAEDGKQTVAKYLEEVSKAAGCTVKVKRFVRFETGEGLEKKQEDFAAEVAAQMNA